MYRKRKENETENQKELTYGSGEHIAYMLKNVFSKENIFL